MSSSKKRLGRGLASLLSEDFAVEAAGAAPKVTVGESEKQSEIAIDRLEPSPFQARRDFPEASLRELAQSIQSSGVIQPLVVRANPNAPDRYQIIAGERRWRAAQRVAVHSVPVRILALSDQECLEAGLIENTQREDLNAIDEATAYGQLVRDFGYSQTRLADQLGKSRPHIANTLRLLELPSEVQQLVAGGSLSAGHARALIGQPDALALAEQVIEQGLSVRQTEALIAARKAGRTSEAATRANKPLDPDTEAVRRSLEDYLGLKVELRHKNGRGKVSILFNDGDQFQALLAKLGS